MNSANHQRLYSLLEYKVLNASRKKLVAAHVLDGLSLAAGCKLIGLNVSRESKNSSIAGCLAAYRRAQDPEGKDEIYETVRRMEILWCGINNPNLAYDQFATVNLPWGPERPGLFLTPDGKTVDAAGQPVPAPPRPAPTAPTPEALPTIPCAGCEKTIPDGSPRFTKGSPGLQFTVCGHCNHVWGHTGICPTGPTDPNLTRVELKWGLNVKTVPDYAEPLP